MTAEAGHAPNRAYFDQSGNLHLNGGKVLDANELDVTGSVTGLLASGAELNRNNKVSTRIVTAITTLAVTEALHEGKTVVLSLLAGFATTLPAATGGGARYKFVIGIVNTSNNYVISAVGTDIFQGTITGAVTTAATGKSWTAGATDNTITLDGTTKGGASIGDTLFIEDVAAGVWAVNGRVCAIVGGGLATPFSHV